MLQTELQCIISRYNDSVLYHQTASSVHRSYYLLYHTGSEGMCYTDDHRNLIKAQNEMCCVTMNTQRLRVNKAQPVVTFQDPGLFFPFPKNIAFSSTW